MVSVDVVPLRYLVVFWLCFGSGGSIEGGDNADCTQRSPLRRPR